MNKACLDWYRANLCDSDERSAWYTIHLNGPRALLACQTPEDYTLMANAMEVAAALILDLPEHIRNGTHSPDGAKYQ